MVANLHADPRYQIRLGTVLDIGRPRVDDSELTHLLVSLPYPYGPTLEYFQADGFQARILWLLPINSSEAAYASLHGVEELEREFDRSGINYLDVHRSSVVENPRHR